MSVAIKIENLSKAYQLGQIGTGTISRDIERWFAMARGKEDPFLKVGEVNDRTVISNSNIVWSLNDITADITQGDAVGIIGRNGAGKSTLLKILSRVTSPTKGTVKAKGRIASLLEVGTGFHPELTGKENIFLNGAILGMRKKEISRKLDEIISFSGVERYIDTPVKRYSSGMYVRLAFAVAAHLESEILIVDEVLAVGDAEFQKKCLGKMKDVSKAEGRTVLFVSHNMAAVQQLCNHLIYLKNGIVEYKGDVMEGLNKYYASIRQNNTNKDLFAVRDTSNKKAWISGFQITQTGSTDSLQITLYIQASLFIEKAELAVGINDGLGVRIITLHSRFTQQQFDLQPGVNTFTCHIKNLYLKQDAYTANIFLGNKYETLDYLDDPLDFEIPEYIFYNTGIVPDNSQGYIMANHTWIRKNDN